jgi:hypothetical protein
MPEGYDTKTSMRREIPRTVLKRTLPDGFPVYDLWMGDKPLGVYLRERAKAALEEGTPPLMEPMVV